METLRGDWFIGVLRSGSGSDLDAGPFVNIWRDHLHLLDHSRRVSAGDRHRRRRGGICRATGPKAQRCPELLSIPPVLRNCLGGLDACKVVALLADQSVTFATD